MRKATIFVLLSLALVSTQCKKGGGGGAGAPAVTAPTQSWVGTYALRSFDLFFDGLILTEEDVANWSGEMIVTPMTILQTVAIDDLLIEFSTNNYLITGSSAGTVIFYDEQGNQDSVDYSVIGNKVMTHAFGSIDGVVFEQFQVWEKISDQATLPLTLTQSIVDLPDGKTDPLSLGRAVLSANPDLLDQLGIAASD